MGAGWGWAHLDVPLSPLLYLRLARAGRVLGAGWGWERWWGWAHLDVPLSPLLYLRLARAGGRVGVGAVVGVGPPRCTTLSSSVPPAGACWPRRLRSRGCRSTGRPSPRTFGTLASRAGSSATRSSRWPPRRTSPPAGSLKHGVTGGGHWVVTGVTGCREGPGEHTLRVASSASCCSRV